MNEETSPRPRQVDMSPEAIDRRLRDVGQLYKLGMSLRKARYLGPADEQQRAKDPSRTQPEPT